LNWVNELYALYEKNESLAGKIPSHGNDESAEPVLLPLSHTTVLAQIEVTIDRHGNFLRARRLAKEEASTIIPVSESSAIRTSGPVPHPLMDSLQYIAGDYDTFTQAELDKKGNVVTYRSRYDEYIHLLEDWCTSEHAHPKAVSVFTYLKKARLMEDLIHEKILIVDGNSFLVTDEKIQNIVQEKSFVRFRVETGEIPDFFDDSGRFLPEIWADTTLQKSYCAYFDSLPANVDLCYLTGNIGRTTESYPKKIRNEGDGTKLLSSNDSAGYTFRGRFRESKEAFSIGYEASQKAHNALKWIIRKQGYTRDGLCVVTWESDLRPYVSIFDDAADVVMQAPPDSFIDDLSDTAQPEEDTNHITAAQFNKALRGYVQNVANTSNMVVMALDAATPGRLAITYFNQLPSSHYLENIKFWHESCCWRHAKFVNKQLVFFDGMAALYDIALALYGTEQNKFLKLKTDSNGKAPMLVSTVQRLTPCLLEQKRIPKDMMRLAVLRASTPLAYEKNNWRKILAIACSIVKKAKHDWKGEKWDMALQENCTDRSYLYGRLLAVADLVENDTFDGDDRRETNAMRYMNAFSRRPFRTWKIIEERLLPYFNKLSIPKNIYYKKLMNEIQDKFTPEAFSDDSVLDGLYLLGYHSQVNKHYSKKEDKNIIEQDKNEGEIIE